MHKITLKDFRFLHDFVNDHIDLVLMAGDNFIDVNKDTFRSSTGHRHIDRPLIRNAFRQRGLDTLSWSYWTNGAGLLLLTINSSCNTLTINSKLTENIGGVEMKKDHKKCCICGKPARRWSDYCQKCDALEYEKYVRDHGDAGKAPMMNGSQP